jgi:charged multivesicular body protein 7
LVESLDARICKKYQFFFSSRRRALTSFKAGNKKAACRYVRQSKLLSESRNKCIPLLERVEEVISLISIAESTKQV